jgi:hypothetical protein
MYPDGIAALLKEVILSWHVIAITIALVIYMNIVFYVARSYRRPKIKRVRVKKTRASKTKDDVSGLPDDGSDPNDELGLEEA